MVLQRLKANTSLGGIPVIIVTAEDPQVAEARTIEGRTRLQFYDVSGCTDVAEVPRNYGVG
jgi:hypothetical protein